MASEGLCDPQRCPQGQSRQGMVRPEPESSRSARPHPRIDGSKGYQKGGKDRGLTFPRKAPQAHLLWLDYLSAGGFHSARALASFAGSLSSKNWPKACTITTATSDSRPLSFGSIPTTSSTTR